MINKLKRILKTPSLLGLILNILMPAQHSYNPDIPIRRLILNILMPAQHSYNPDILIRILRYEKNTREWSDWEINYHK
jgi:hypothetical protein